MNQIASRRPEHGEYSSPYHRQLIDAVAGECVLKVLHEQQHWIANLDGNLSTDHVDKVHSPYGWSIRQVFEHCADAERVFGYRMLRLAAGDATPLPGWDENLYADSRFGLGNFVQLVAELQTLRSANLLLLRRIVPAAWNQSGQSDNQTVSVRSLAWVTAGHLQHHLQIVEQRCGIQVPRVPPPDTMM